MNEIIGFAAVIVSIFAGILFQNGRLDRVESRLAERIDKNHSELGGRIDRVESGLMERIDRVESDLTERMDKNHFALGARLDRLQADLIVFYRDLGRHDAKIEILEKKAS